MAASLFGHILLRLVYRDDEGATPLHIAETMAFLADNDVPFQADRAYALKGIAGYYTASLHERPFLDAYREYVVLEGRDLRRWRLNLSPAERRDLMERLWTAEHASRTSYYFFHRNCATLMLEIVDQVRPSGLAERCAGAARCAARVVAGAAGAGDGRRRSAAAAIRRRAALELRSPGPDHVPPPPRRRGAHRRARRQRGSRVAAHRVRRCSRRRRCPPRRRLPATGAAAGGPRCRRGCRRTRVAAGQRDDREPPVHARQPGSRGRRRPRTPSEGAREGRGAARGRRGRWPGRRAGGAHRRRQRRSRRPPRRLPRPPPLRPARRAFADDQAG